MTEHCVANILLANRETFYTKIVTLIPINIVPNWLLSLFVLLYELKTKTIFSGSWWSGGNEKYFCYLFIVSRALLQRANSIDFNKRNFIYVTSARS